MLTTSLLQYRPNVPKLIILLTDGSQTKTADSVDPAIIARKIRNSNVLIYVIGIGSNIVVNDLAKIAGSTQNVFTASSFDSLISPTFVKKFSFETCEKGKKQLYSFNSTYMLTNCPRMG